MTEVMCIRQRPSVYTSATKVKVQLTCLKDVDNFSFFLFVIISFCKYPVIQPMAAMVFNKVSISSI